MLPCMFIPAMRPLIAMLAENRILCIVSSLVGIVIATLLLIVDFDAVKQGIDRQIPKQYEWFAAFSLTFSVVWLYFKIFQLLAELKKSDSK